MTGPLVGGLALAAASTGALSYGFLVQHDVASRLPPLAVGRPARSLKLLFLNGRWLVGFLVGIAGWALYVAALELAPLSLVQAISAGGIGLLALLAEQATGLRLSRREWLGAGAAVGGLVLLAVSLAGGVSGGRHPSLAAVAAWVGASLAAAAIAGGPVRRCLRSGLALGVAAGTLYAAGDVATKAAVVGGSIVVLLVFAVAVLVCHGLAFVALQLGFQRGGVLATAGISSLLTNALPILAGMVVFAEGLPAEPLGALRLLGFAAVVCGAAGLGRVQPSPRAQPPAPGPRSRGQVPWESGLTRANATRERW